MSLVSKSGRLLTQISTKVGLTLRGGAFNFGLQLDLRLRTTSRTLAMRQPPFETMAVVVKMCSISLQKHPEGCSSHSDCKYSCLPSMMFACGFEILPPAAHSKMPCSSNEATGSAQNLWTTQTNQWQSMVPVSTRTTSGCKVVTHGRARHGLRDS